jgi:hypothetical protein
MKLTITIKGKSIVEEINENMQILKKETMKM